MKEGLNCNKSNTLTHTQGCHCRCPRLLQVTYTFVTMKLSIWSAMVATKQKKKKAGENGVSQVVEKGKNHRINELNHLKVEAETQTHCVLTGCWFHQHKSCPQKTQRGGGEGPGVLVRVPSGLSVNGGMGTAHPLSCIHLWCCNSRHCRGVQADRLTASSLSSYSTC